MQERIRRASSVRRPSRKASVKEPETEESSVELDDCLEIIRILENGQEKSGITKTTPEEVLLIWINFHLKKAGYRKEVTNLDSDLSDSTALLHLLN